MRCDSRAEVDFLAENANGDLFAIEAKSGTSVKSKSLDVFLGRYPDTKAIRISGRNFGSLGNVRSVPLYAAGFVE